MTYLIELVKFGCEEEKFRDACTEQIECPTIGKLARSLLAIEKSDWDEVRVSQVRIEEVAKIKLIEVTRP